jgi:hypothetical protein
MPRSRQERLAARLPASTPALAVRVVEPLRVLSLRHLPGGSVAVLSAAGIAAPPQPGRFLPHERRGLTVAWRSPTELLCIAMNGLGKDVENIALASAVH